MKGFDIKSYLEYLKKIGTKKLTYKEKLEQYNKTNSRGCNCK